MEDGQEGCIEPVGCQEWRMMAKHRDKWKALIDKGQGATGIGRNKCLSINILREKLSEGA